VALMREQKNRTWSTRKSGPRARRELSENLSEPDALRENRLCRKTGKCSEFPTGAIDWNVFGHNEEEILGRWKARQEFERIQMRLSPFRQKTYERKCTKIYATTWKKCPGNRILGGPGNALVPGYILSLVDSNNYQL
jgi:hypothetical protein